MKHPFTDKQSHTSCTPAMKMADLLKGNRKLLSLISRLGMELGVSEKSVDEIHTLISHPLISETGSYCAI